MLSRLNFQRFSTLCRKSAPKVGMFGGVKPVTSLRQMSTGLDMKPQNAMLWFIGMSIPIAAAAYGASKEILGRFDKADSGKYGPVTVTMNNDEWLEFKEKARAMEEEDEVVLIMDNQKN